MDELKVIFDPEEKDKLVIKDVEKLKESLNKKQISATMFTMIIDSIENKGEICMLNTKQEDKSDMIFDFERV